jgi:hypothetical protein
MVAFLRQKGKFIRQPTKCVGWRIKCRFFAQKSDTALQEIKHLEFTHPRQLLYV